MVMDFAENRKASYAVEVRFMNKTIHSFPYYSIANAKQFNMHIITYTKIVSMIKNSSMMRIPNKKMFTFSF